MSNSIVFTVPITREEFNRLARILKQLRQSCQTEEGEDDLKKGTQLLEVFKLALVPFPYIFAIYLDDTENPM